MPAGFGLQVVAQYGCWTAIINLGGELYQVGAKPPGAASRCSCLKCMRLTAWRPVQGRRSKRRSTRRWLSPSGRLRAL